MAQSSPLDPLVGTVSAKFIPSYSAGALSGCGVEFSALMKDWHYRQGSFVRVGGQFGLMGTKSNIGVILKVMVHDMDPKAMTFKPSTPDSAQFTLSGLTPSRPTNQIASDTPGAVFMIFDIQTMEPLFEAIAKGRVSFIVTRKKGGMGMPVTIETDVVDTNQDGTRQRDPRNVDQVFACFAELAKNYK